MKFNIKHLLLLIFNVYVVLYVAHYTSKTADHRAIAAQFYGALDQWAAEDLTWQMLPQYIGAYRAGQILGQVSQILAFAGVVAVNLRIFCPDWFARHFGTARPAAVRGDSPRRRRRADRVA